MYIGTDKNQYTGRNVYVAANVDMAMERIISTLQERDLKNKNIN